MNWNQLKDFCNSLDEEQLKHNVILWREDEAITDIDAITLEEDHYINPEASEGCFPESEANYLIKTDPESYPDGIDFFTKVYDKGHPVLHENF